MEDGRWKMEDGRWKMEDRRWDIAHTKSQRHKGVRVFFKAKL